MSYRIGLAAFVLLAMVTPAWAQKGQDGEYEGVVPGDGGAYLLANKGLQQELKVSEDQAAQMNALAEERKMKSQAVLSQLTDLPPQERQTKFQELQFQATAEVRKRLTAILNPGQIKRFNQIVTQHRWIEAFTTPDNQKALKLTGIQVTKIREIEREFKELAEREHQKHFGPNSTEEERLAWLKKMMEQGKLTEEKVLGLLTVEQKAIWKDLTGEPYLFTPNFIPSPKRALEQCGP